MQSKKPQQQTPFQPNHIIATIMFKKFSKEEISSNSLIKSSVQRGIRTTILEQYPALESVIDEILPKKSPMTMVKVPDRINIVTIDNVPLFFNSFDGPWFPTLRLLHQYPDMMPRLQVDRGAIKFVLSGAMIMCPGLTSPGAKMPDDVVAKDQPVAIYAEGKEHAIAVGITKMSTKDIREVNKGVGVDTMNHLGDGLWKTPNFE